MSKIINENLSKEFRLGQVGVNNQGLKMTIIAYRDCKDIDVQFEDGTIVENRQYGEFLKGTIANPNILSDGISIPEKFIPSESIL